MKKKILFFLPIFLFGAWNNNYSFGGDKNSSIDAAINILSMIVVVYGIFLFFHTLWKLLGSNEPQEKTRGALISNVFLLMLSLLFIANKWVILSLVK